MRIVREYDWPVPIKVPEGSRHVTKNVTVRFRVLGQDRIDQIVHDGDANRADIRLVKEAVVGWADGAFEDEAGNAIPCSAEALDELLGIPYVRVALGQAYIRSLGLPEADRKN